MRIHSHLTAAVAVLLLTTAITAGVGAQTETATPTPAASFTHDGDSLVVESAPSQQLDGTTSLPAGTRLTLRISSTDASAPFLRRVEATVTDEGTFAATMDVSNIDPATEFEATVRYNGSTIAETTGRVVACTSDCTQTASDTDRATTTYPADEAGFADSIVQVRQGKTVEISVAVGDRQRYRLTVGDQSVNYVLNATLVDGNDDGRVVAVFDTAAAGTDTPTLEPAADGDRITIESESTLPDSLDPSEYDLALSTTDGEVFDIGTLVVMNGQTATQTPATGNRSATPTAPLDDTTPAHGGIDLSGVGALGAGLLLGVVGIALLLGLRQH